jgi:hypothetical protein
MDQETQPTFWAAPDLIKAGYPVFPLAGKVPAVAGGFYAATTDMSEIAMWIEAGFGDHDIGIATGHASGIVVIEADTPTRRLELEKMFGPPTALTRKGAHWYFKHPRDGKVVSRSIASSVDCKADGGYVAAPPSTNKTWTNGIPDKTTLPELPTRLREDLRSGTQPQANESSAGQIQLVGELEQLEAAAVVARHVKNLPQGKRHEHLRHICGALLGRGVMQESAEKILIQAWQLVGGELADRALKEVPNTLNTTAVALTNGGATGVPSMEKLTPGLFDELEAILSREDPVLTDKAPGVLRKASYGPLGERILIGKLIEEGIEPPTHLEPDILLEGAIHWFHGTADTGKTWLAAYIVKHRIDAGENVLIWDKENGPEIYGERLELLGCDPETIDKHFFYHSEPNLRLDEDVLEAYAMHLEEVDPVLVIFDSARGFLTSAGLEENSNDDLDRWYESILKPVRNRKIAAMVLDHDPKDGASARGAGRKKDLCDVMFSIKCPYPFNEDSVGAVRLVLEKGRRGGLSPTVIFSVGGSAEGFIFERSAGTIEMEDEETGLTPSARKALESLTDFGEAGSTWKQWWDASSIQSKATFNKARNELLQHGRAVQRDQRYFVTGGRGISRSITGLIDLDIPKAERSTRSTPLGRVDLVDFSEDQENVRANGAVSQGNGTALAGMDKVRTVAGLFSDPPEWLVKQLKVYRKNPDLHLKPLCAAVAAVVLEDGNRGPEVAEEVRKEVGDNTWEPSPDRIRDAEE